MGQDMFRQFYEMTAWVFMLQGVLIPWLVVVASFFWFRQMARSTALETSIGQDRSQSDRTLTALLRGLPKLKPLYCAGCGGAIVLEEEAGICTNCRALSALPEDYAATRSLRVSLRRLTASAIRHWWVARLLTSTPARLGFFVMIFAEPLIFMIVLIGAGTYRDTVLDRALEWVGEPWAYVLGGMAFCGFIIWMIVFVALTNLSKELRRELPPAPAFAKSQGETMEFAECRSCGGGLHFGSRAFACLCTYCRVENFRADYAGRQRAESEAARVDTKSTLFAAMEIISGFTVTFFVTMTILALAFALLALYSWFGS